MKFTCLSGELSAPGNLGRINSLNTQWTERWTEPGDFMIKTSVEDFDRATTFIMCDVRRSTGIVNKVHKETDNTGTYYLVSGFFLEKRLDDDLIHPVYTKSGNTEIIARDLIATFCTIPNLQLGAVTGKGSTVEFQNTGGALGEQLYALLSSDGLSYALRYDYSSATIFFDILAGVDRTETGRSDTPSIVFSEDLKNMENPSYIWDDSNYKNYFIVAGQGEGTARVSVVVDLSNGERKRKKFIDARDLSQDSQTLSQYRAQLTQRGREKALEYAIIEDIEFTPVLEGLEYRTDFDIGDYCTIKTADKTFTSQIVEVPDVEKERELV